MSLGSPEPRSRNRCTTRSTRARSRRKRLTVAAVALGKARPRAILFWRQCSAHWLRSRREHGSRTEILLGTTQHWVHNFQAEERHRRMLGGELFLRSGGTTPVAVGGAGHLLLLQAPTMGVPALGGCRITGLLFLRLRMRISLRAPQVSNRRH